MASRRVRITVRKRQFYPEMAAEYLSEGEAVGACALLSEGQTFVFEGEARMPEGFCPWAWHDIYTNVAALHSGGSYDPWNKRPGQSVVCCTDGIRPVTFVLTAMEE